MATQCYWSHQSPRADNDVLASAHSTSGVLQIQENHCQEIGLSQAAEQELLEGDCNDSGNNSDDDINIEDSNACSDKENLLLSRRAAWLQNDFYKGSFLP